MVLSQFQATLSVFSALSLNALEVSLQNTSNVEYDIEEGSTFSDTVNVVGSFITERLEEDKISESNTLISIKGLLYMQNGLLVEIGTELFIDNIKYTVNQIIQHIKDIDSDEAFYSLTGSRNG